MCQIVVLIFSLPRYHRIDSVCVCVWGVLFVTCLIDVLVLYYNTMLKYFCNKNCNKWKKKEKKKKPIYSYQLAIHIADYLPFTKSNFTNILKTFNHKQDSWDMERYAYLKLEWDQRWDGAIDLSWKYLAGRICTCWFAAIAALVHQLRMRQAIVQQLRNRKLLLAVRVKVFNNYGNYTLQLEKQKDRKLN